jgi:hypothetical protein
VAAEVTMLLEAANQAQKHNSAQQRRQKPPNYHTNPKNGGISHAQMGVLL